MYKRNVEDALGSVPRAILRLRLRDCLQDYKKDPSNAEPYLSVTFFDDFLDKKGIVLVRGDFSGHLTKEVRRLC